MSMSMQAPMQPSGSTLVILEAGTRWPEWLPDGASYTSFVQSAQERVSDFHERVEWCVERLRSCSSAVVVVCGDAAVSDPHALESRRCLLLALVAHLERAGGGKLVLAGAGHYGARRALADLTLEVSEFLDDVGSPVSCRMRAQRRRDAA
jgi:hypothetical protein